MKNIFFIIVLILIFFSCTNINDIKKSSNPAEPVINTILTPPIFVNASRKIDFRYDGNVIGINLSWFPSPYADVYYIYRSIYSNSGFTPINFLINSDIYDYYSYTSKSNGFDTNINFSKRYYYKIVSSNFTMGVSEPSSVISFQLLTDDIYESDNSFDTANFLNIGSGFKQFHTISPSDDKDYFKFNATKNFWYSIEASYSNYPFSVDVSLYDSNKNLINFSYNHVFTADYTGIYYFKILDNNLKGGDYNVYFYIY